MKNRSLPHMRSESGFSMIELVVVLGVMGVLAAVAVPQFAIYQARARQGEIKISLTSAFTALQTFSIATGSFTQCLQDIGLRSTGNVRYYSAGFGAGSSSPAVGHFFAFDGNGVGVPGRECTEGAAPSSNIPIAATLTMGGSGGSGLGGINTLGTFGGGVASTSVGTSTFLLGGEGLLRGGGVGIQSKLARVQNDAWTMDHNKVLRNVQDGLSAPPTGPAEPILTVSVGD